MNRTVSIALAFVGLLVGAGFATGREIIQYFISFGTVGLWGAVLSGVFMALAGAVFLQLGSYFLANEHNLVFRNLSFAWLSWLLDVMVTLTLFAIGFVMLAGAGSNLEQQFGWPSWIGSGLMLILVIVTGFFDVDKVSNIISWVTPLIIVAVIVAFIYTLFHIPQDTAHLSELAQRKESPVSPWWLAALNYNGLALLLGVSMSIVIGGNHTDTTAAARGGLAGGVLYTVMLLMAAVTLFLSFDQIADADVPMLTIMENIHPALALVMVWIIFAMIYNTCIGMFYSLGKRLTAKNEKHFIPVFVVLCLMGYAVSFVGFSELMSKVYPIIGYAGMFMVVVLLGFWIRSRVEINRESRLRDKIRRLVRRREDPTKRFTSKQARELEHALAESQAEAEQIEETISEEVRDELNLESPSDQAEEENTKTAGA
ncbi:hypothetical protein GP475_05095 [Corynebacterium poyangense]|uniref:Uncharacterized protein n=1 Tax=Corynebacterium poyangense TaxID=2684405 RepID=A0A7H0SNG5_9CORY|nr:hypothetical protein [Corynebacterium poyangense]MBZ8177120.1 hypothetical protein [Corynebacterium poyangense]QNQ90090.1 hypothetical protein GP475_05095 [Corynebacterium poyangense]